MASWFTFSGVPDLASDPLNYTIVGSQPTTCSGTNQVCAIFAPNSGSNVMLTDAVQNDIIDALNSRTDIPGKVLLRS